MENGSKELKIIVAYRLLNKKQKRKIWEFIFKSANKPSSPPHDDMHKFANDNQDTEKEQDITKQK